MQDYRGLTATASPPPLSKWEKITLSSAYREDEINSEAFKSKTVANFSEVNESLLKSLGNGSLFSKIEECAIFPTELTE